MVEETITGTLHNWDVQILGTTEYVIWGDVKGDVHGRFPDGTTIHTSGIKHADFPVEELKEGDVVKTRNSTYKLGESLFDKIQKNLNAENLDAADG